VVNVYVPGDAGKSRSKDDLLPVMFWIHGGGYIFGSGSPDFYGPERFMDYGVVSVFTASEFIIIFCSYFTFTPLKEGISIGA